VELSWYGPQQEVQLIYGVLTTSAMRDNVTFLRLELNQPMTSHSAYVETYSGSAFDRDGSGYSVLQRLLGHLSIAATEIYTHVSDEALRAALERANVLGALAAR
jgi:integrase